MNKALLVGGLVVVVGAGYGVGTVLTGQQVNKEYQRYVDVVAENYQGVANVSSTIESSLFSSHNTLTLEFLDLPAPVIEWAGTNVISFDIDYSHQFLASNSAMKISETELLGKIKPYQVDAGIAPFLLSSTYKYDVLKGSVQVEGDILTDGVKVVTNELKLDVGSSIGKFSIIGDTANIEWSMKPSTLSSKEVNIDVGKVSLNETLSALDGEILAAKVIKSSSAQFVIDRIGIEDVRGQTQVDLSVFAIDVDKQLNDDRTEFTLNYGSDTLVVKSPANSYSIDKPELKMRLDIDSQALINFVSKVNERRLANGGTIEDPTSLIPMLSEITNKGISFDIDRLAVSANGETAEGSSQLVMQPFSIEEIQLDRQAVIKKMDLNTQLGLPKKLLESMPGFNAEQFGFFVGMGFLLEQEKQYTFQIQAKDGVVKLNGNAIPLF